MMKNDSLSQYFVYIDESNISTNLGHSAYSCVFVLCINKDDIEKELNITYLHWVDMPWKLRIKFAEKIKNLDFVCKCTIFKNPINQEVVLTDFISNIINNDLFVSKITVDGKKPKHYISRLKKKLRKQGVIFDKLLFTNDKSESFLRLADFIAGLIRSYIDNKNESNEYMFDILKRKIKIPN